jgi:hypothetical protein
MSVGNSIKKICAEIFLPPDIIPTRQGANRKISLNILNKFIISM